MPLDDVNETFAMLAHFVDDDLPPKEKAVVTAALALCRIIVTDLRRIADAQEACAKQYVADWAATRAGKK